MSRCFIISVLLFSHLSFAEVPVKIIDLSLQETKVEFQATGKPGFIKINGTGGKLEGKIEVKGASVFGKLTVLLKPITTGITLRDEHMKDKYLEVAKYPEATLQLVDLKLSNDLFALRGGFRGIPLKAKLTVHGVEKEVEGTVDIDSDEKTISISAQIKTAVSSHKIDIPSYMGIKVADDIQILTQVKVKK